jgi:hypothetical protein
LKWFRYSGPIGYDVDPQKFERCSISNVEVWMGRWRRKSK